MSRRNNDSTNNHDINFDAPRINTHLSYTSLLHQGSSTPSQAHLNTFIDEKAPTQVLQMDVNARMLRNDRLCCTDESSNVLKQIYEEMDKELMKHSSLNQRNIHVIVTGVIVRGDIVDSKYVKLECVTPGEEDASQQLEFYAKPLQKDVVVRAIKILDGWKDEFNEMNIDALFNVFLTCLEEKYPFDNDVKKMTEFIEKYLCRENEVILRKNKVIKRWCGDHFDDPNLKKNLSTSKWFLRRFIEENVVLVFGIAIHALSGLHRSCCRKRLHSGSTGQQSYQEYFDRSSDPHSKDTVNLHYYIPTNLDELQHAIKNSTQTSRNLQRQHANAKSHSLNNHLNSMVGLLENEFKDAKLNYLFPKDDMFDNKDTTALSLNLGHLLPTTMQDVHSKNFTELKSNRRRRGVTKIYWDCWYGGFIECVESVLKSSLSTSYSKETIKTRNEEPLLESQLSSINPSSVNEFLEEFRKYQFNLQHKKLLPGQEYSKRRIKYTSTKKSNTKNGSDLDAIVYCLLLFSRLDESCYKAVKDFLSIEHFSLLDQDERNDLCTEVLQAAHFAITHSANVMTEAYCTSLDEAQRDRFVNGGASNLAIPIRGLSFVRLIAPMIYQGFSHRIGWNLKESTILESLRHGCLGIDYNVFENDMRNTYLLNSIDQTLRENGDCRRDSSSCYLLVEGYIALVWEIPHGRFGAYFSSVKDQNGNFVTIPKTLPIEPVDFNFLRYINKVHDDRSFRERISSTLRLRYSKLIEPLATKLYEELVVGNNMKITTQNATKKVQKIHQSLEENLRLMSELVQILSREHDISFPPTTDQSVIEAHDQLALPSQRFICPQTYANMAMAGCCNYAECFVDFLDADSNDSLISCSDENCNNKFHKCHLDAKHPDHYDSESALTDEPLCQVCLRKKLKTDYGTCNYCQKDSLLGALMRCNCDGRGYFHLRCFDSHTDHWFHLTDIKDHKICSSCLFDIYKEYCCNYGSGPDTCPKLGKKLDPDDDSVFKCGNCWNFAHEECTVPSGKVHIPNRSTDDTMNDPFLTTGLEQVYCCLKCKEHLERQIK